MSAIQPRAGDFARGLETTRDVRSSDPLAFRVFDNARTNGGHAKRRKGRALVYRFAAAADLMDFDGSNDKVALSTDSRLFPFATTRWTLEWLIYTDTIAATGFPLGRTGASATGVTLSHNSAGAIVCVVTDSAANATTLTIAGVSAAVKHPVQLVRDGASLTLRIPGYTSATGTMSATNTLATGACSAGEDNNGSFYNGAVDFFRGFRVVKADQADGWARLPDPRAPSVAFDYVFVADANGYILDRGPLSLHASQTGSPTTRAVLAVNPMPVLGIGMTVDNDASRQGYVRAGAQLFPVDFS